MASSIRLIFVDGPPKSGKSKFMNSQLDGCALCFLPQKEFITLHLLHKDGRLTLEETVRYMHEVYVNSVKVAIEHAIEQKYSVIAIEGNPLYFRNITPLVDNKYIDKFGVPPDNDAIATLLKLEAFPYKVYLCLSDVRVNMDGCLPIDDDYTARWTKIYGRYSKNFGKGVTRVVYGDGGAITTVPWTYPEPINRKDIFPL